MDDQEAQAPLKDPIQDPIRDYITFPLVDPISGCTPAADKPCPFVDY